ncbi:MAG: hypothetical protein HKL80_01905 [Acidimicrobiales bacterium]|nr:hypothetical protein [Acidimicrobiales bacterium]
MNIFKKTTIALALSASISAIGGSAFAATTSTTSAPPVSKPSCSTDFSQAKSLVLTELNNRVTSLQSLTKDVGNAKYLTSNDSAALSSEITSEISGINALITSVNSTTTCSELRVNAYSMVYTYRVYLVMAPKTHLTISADAVTSISSELYNLEPEIQAAINAASANGKNVAQAQSAFADFQSQVSSAQSASNGMDQTLLAQTPAGSPGNWSTFVSSKNSLETARGDLHQAHTDLTTIVKSLKLG